MNLTNFNDKKLVFLLLAALALGILLVIFVLSNLLNQSEPQQNTEQPLATPTTTRGQTQPVSPLQRTIIGQTSTEEIEANNEILSTESLPNGNTRYSLPSSLTSRPDTIITEDGIAVYERVMLPEEPSSEGFRSFSSIELQHGEPEETITGSDFYGWYIEHRIYASSGFTAVGNPNTDEVYEIQTYEPMAIEDYLNLYGEDINPELEHRDERPNPS